MRYIEKLLPVFAVMLVLIPGLAIAQADISHIRNLVSEGKLEQALSETDAILATDKDNMQGLFMKGLIYTRMNKLDKAEEIFVQLNKDHPELPEPYNNLAVIYASQGQFEKARDALQKAINTHPSYATAHENLGDIYAKMASRAYNQALEIDNSNETAREKLALINDLFSAPATSKKEEKPVEVAKAVPVEKKEETKPAPVEERTPEPVAKVTPAEPQEPVVAVASPTPVEPVLTEPEPVAVKINPIQVTQTILSKVDNWSKAWSGQDINAYLACYAEDYKPDLQTSHSDWVEQRKSRLSEPSYIKLNISDIKVVMHGDEHAQATFLQDYQSDSYSDSVTKKLLYRKIGDRWLIVQEKSE